MYNSIRVENGTIVEVKSVSQGYILKNNEYSVSVNGDALGKVYNTETGEITDQPLEILARQWRDSELQATDWIVPVTDHPQHAQYLRYRQGLRDFPSSEGFPDTRPTLEDYADE